MNKLLIDWSRIQRESLDNYIETTLSHIAGNWEQEQIMIIEKSGSHSLRESQHKRCPIR